VLFINVSLTVWILVSISFNYVSSLSYTFEFSEYLIILLKFKNGMIGNVKFSHNGVKLDGKTVVLDELITSKVVSSSSSSKKNHKNNNLEIYADQSIRFFSKNNAENKLKNTLTMSI
jgi:hypothetical protein